MPKPTDQERLAAIGIMPDTPAVLSQRKAAYANSDYKLLMHAVVFDDLGSALKTTPEFLAQDVQKTIDAVRMAAHDGGGDLQKSGFFIMLRLAE
jgi:hypothetical protein